MQFFFVWKHCRMSIRTLRSLLSHPQPIAATAECVRACENATTQAINRQHNGKSQAQ